MITNRRIETRYNKTWPAMLTFLSVVLLPGIALAASPEWRAHYDLAMKWFNFILLSAVIYKYGRGPMKQFLSGQKEDTAAQLNALEEEKARYIDEIKAAKLQTEENQQRLLEMKDRLIAQGEAHKQAVIDQARSQSVAMIEAARAKMETRILQAKTKLKLELADMAFEQATTRLPGLITDTDNQMFLDNYMTGMQIKQDQA